jgi:UDP-glucose 4-epimerase
MAGTTWLLTGGAGYIGNHISRALLDSGRSVVVLDDLSTGNADLVPDDVPLVVANCADADAVRTAIEHHDVAGVVHLAAKKAAGESVERPLWYYRQNVDGTIGVLEAMQATGVDRLVFSSSCATIGTPEREEVTEESTTAPESPYGETKLVSEWLIRDVARASELQYATLRYFNVAGAGSPELGDTGVFNLIPLIFRAISTGARPQVYGDDYDTRDGSCIRDYIHVSDLADAHVAAADRLESGPLREVYNVGRGQGVTVKEVMSAVREVTSAEFDYEVTARRPGDPARIVAVAGKINRELGWSARHDLHDMVRSAWDAWQEHPS